jgi:uncharacterized protein involved in cysteine biosynthesis
VLRVCESVNLSAVESIPSAAAPPRPGVLRRAAAGAWQIPAAMGMLVRTPALWPVASLLSAVSSAGLAGGVLAAAYAFPWAERLTSPGPSAHWLLTFAFTFSLCVSVIVVGIAGGLGVALLLLAPLAGSLCSKVEAELGGPARPKISVGARRHGPWLLAAAAPGAALLGLVPLVGLAFVVCFVSAVLAAQAVAAPLASRGLDFAARREWLRCWFAESAGLGLASTVALLAPGINVLLAPTLSIAGSRLVLELGVRRPAPRPPPAQAPAGRS